MAKRKAISPPPPTVAEILSIGTGELSKLDEKEMRKLVNVLVSAGNKRLRRLEKNAEKGIAPEALNAVMNTGGKFSARGKNRNELFRELVRARNFFDSPLSTVEGAKNERKRRERALFGETREEREKRMKKELKRRQRQTERKRKGKRKSKRKAEPEPEPEELKEESAYDSADWDPEQQLKNTFRAFRMFKAAYPALMKAAGLDSSELLQMIGNFTMGGLTAEEAVNAAYNSIIRQYEDAEAARQDAEKWEWTDV